MKMQIVVILSLLFSFSSNAFAVADTMAPEVKIVLGDNKAIEVLAKGVKEILLQGNWLETLTAFNIENGIDRIYKFQEIGRLEITTLYANGHSEVENKVWRISTKGDSVILTLTDLGSDESTAYQIEKTDDGLTLTDNILARKLNWIFQ